MKKALAQLRPLINRLPTYDNNYQSFYNIIGVHDKENYNSNALAYFFNPDAGHGLGTLWIDSLLECLIAKGVEVPDEFELEDNVFVKREKVTSTRKRVDLVVRSETSAIIIENKIGDKNLRNDLANYWKSVKVDYKVGVVLSVEEKQIPKEVQDRFTLVQHNELIEQVKKKLFDTHLEGHEKTRQRIFLEDYFQHINKLYKTYEYQKAMGKEINEYFKYKTEIEQVVAFENAAKGTLTDTVGQLMKENGFEKSRGHFYPKSGKPANVRFYFKNDHLVDGKLLLIFELRKEAVEFGEEICDKINKEWTLNEKAPVVNKHNGKDFFHLGTFWHFSFLQAPEGVDVLEHLTDIIETAYFKVPKGQTVNFVGFCLEELKRLQETK